MFNSMYNKSLIPDAELVSDMIKKVGTYKNVTDNKKRQLAKQLINQHRNKINKFSLAGYRAFPDVRGDVLGLLLTPFKTSLHEANALAKAQAKAQANALAKAQAKAQATPQQRPMILGGQIKAPANYSKMSYPELYALLHGSPDNFAKAQRNTKQAYLWGSGGKNSEKEWAPKVRRVIKNIQADSKKQKWAATKQKLANIRQRWQNKATRLWEDLTPASTEGTRNNPSYFRYDSLLPLASARGLRRPRRGV